MELKTCNFRISNAYADVWIANTTTEQVDYSYGGTRLVQYDVKDDEVSQILGDLMLYESTLKNRLINFAIREGALDALKDKLPEGFLESNVGGARCVIRPKSEMIQKIVSNPTHKGFDAHISLIMASVANVLNEQNGRIKLTPDFGRFASVADDLHKYTQHVLGISCDKGGCGGKASYSATGVIAGMEALNVKPTDAVTLIGSNGAMGSIVLDYLVKSEFRQISVSDIAYNNQEDDVVVPLEANIMIKDAEFGKFTNDCLLQNKVIVATTVGKELENSNWRLIKPGTKLLLAHNLAIPMNESGILIMKALQENNVLAIPGQILTLGGALTSRVEQFWRQNRKGVPFDKKLAHEVVNIVVRFIINRVVEDAAQQSITPFEAMLDYMGSTVPQVNNAMMQ